MPLRTITLLFTLIMTLSLTACERSSAKSPRKPNADPPPPSQVAPPQDNALTTWEVNVEYAEVARIRFRRLHYGDFQSFRAEIPEDLSAADVTVIEGQADDLVANSSEIRFSTPTDPGKRQFLKLRVKLPERDIIIPVTISSSFPLGVGLMIDTYDNDGNLIENPPRMVVTGLGPNNTLQPNEMTFFVPNAPKLDPASSSGFIHVPRSENRIIGLKPYWVYDETHNRFVISQQKMEQLLATLPSRMMSINIGISDRRDFAFPYSVGVYKASASLSGVLVDENDERPLTELAGQPVAIRGQGDRNPLRRVAIADSEGRFSVDDLIPGTYVLELLDPAQNYYAINAYAVYPDTTQLSVKLPVSTLKKKVTQSARSN